MSSSNGNGEEITEQNSAPDRPPLAEHADESSADERTRMGTSTVTNTNSSHLQSPAAVDLWPHLNAVFLRNEAANGGDEATVASTNSSANNSNNNVANNTAGNNNGGEDNQDGDNVWNMSPEELIGSMENWYGRRRTCLEPGAAFGILIVILLLLFIPVFSIIYH